MFLTTSNYLNADKGAILLNEEVDIQIRDNDCSNFDISRQTCQHIKIYVKVQHSNQGKGAKEKSMKQ